MCDSLKIVHIEKYKTCIDKSLPIEHDAGDRRKTLLINPKTISYRKEYSMRRLRKQERRCRNVNIDLYFFLLHVQMSNYQL
jgi:hypothetical protein